MILTSPSTNRLFDRISPSQPTASMEGTKEESKEWRLYLACRQGEKSKVIKLLKEEGADPASTDAINSSTGGAPLHWACYHGWLDIVRDFIEKYNINPELATSYRESPLHCACQGGHVDIVRVRKVKI